MKHVRTRAISEKTCEDTIILSYLPLSCLKASSEARTSFCCCCSHRCVTESQQASEMLFERAVASEGAKKMRLAVLLLCD
ncbi:unnamed protein product [Haemonchus placei]|uniref:Secreted protein n=1 Tax=Haemonchus placei TaxID=6290 RepID=A0A0N4WRA5_HAEPC|nr:unnamed protein product [Haemonchus placei]